MSKRALSRIVVPVVAAACSAIAGPIAASAAAGAPAGPGCRTAAPAVAHYADGVALEPQPAGAPIPCGMHTGFAGGESAIAVTNAGSVFYAPAVQSFAGVQAQYFLGGNSGFARSADLGRTWSFVDPVSIDIALPSQLAGRPGYPAWDQIDDKFFVDRGTGRLFWADPDVPSEAVVWTDDDGLTWGYSLLPVGFGGEWTQITTARARTSTTAGYPNVVYACGEYDSLARDFSYSFEGDLCQKSLDGGQTWIVAGQGLFGSPMAHDPQCNGQSEHPNFSPWAAPDPSGRLFELLYCDGHTFLVRSDDEAASWQIASRLPDDLLTPAPGGTGDAELRSDPAGNLYVAWAGPAPTGPRNGPVFLRISRDYGRTWGPLLNVTAPGVTGIRTHFGFDVAAPGRVAFSYLGHRDGRAGFDGYITQTYDALDPRPVFWSGVVNDTSQTPLDSAGAGSSNGLGLDYISASIAPDGTPWASFWDACAQDLPKPDPACPASRKTPATTTLGYSDFAGRLAPSPTPLPAGLPSARACASRRDFTIRLRAPRGTTPRRAVVFLNGRRVRVLRGRTLRVPIDLRGLPTGRFTVTIRLALADGRTLTTRRTYRTCEKSR